MDWEDKIKYQYHFIATTLSSSIIYGATKSVSCFIVSFISGFFIDLDHLIDYYLQEGLSLKFGDFINYCVERRFKYLILILHSLEYIILLWLIIYLYKLGIFWISLGLGLSQHMLFDIIFNKDIVKTQYFYLITLRAIKGFRFKEFKR